MDPVLHRLATKDSFRVDPTDTGRDAYSTQPRRGGTTSSGRFGHEALVLVAGVVESIEVIVAVEMAVADEGEHLGAVLVEIVEEGVGLRKTEVLAGRLVDGVGVDVRLGFSFGDGLVDVAGSPEGDPLLVAVADQQRPSEASRIGTSTAPRTSRTKAAFPRAE